MIKYIRMLSLHLTKHESSVTNKQTYHIIPIVFSHLENVRVMNAGNNRERKQLNTPSHYNIFYTSNIDFYY